MMEKKRKWKKTKMLTVKPELMLTEKIVSITLLKAQIFKILIEGWDP